MKSDYLHNLKDLLDFKERHLHLRAGLKERYDSHHRKIQSPTRTLVISLQIKTLSQWEQRAKPVPFPYHPKQNEDPTGMETGKRKIPILLEKMQETAMGPDHSRLPTAGERQDN